MLAFFYMAILLLGIPAAITFGILFVLSRARACVFASLLWLVPPGYEYLVQINCTGECNIRVDLLLVMPLEIFVLTLVSWSAVRAFFASRKSGESSTSNPGNP